MENQFKIYYRNNSTTIAKAVLGLQKKKSFISSPFFEYSVQPQTYN